MMRLISAVCLLCLLFCCACLSMQHMQRVTRQLEEILLTGSSYCTESDFSNAQKETERYLLTLRNNRIFFNLFARKETLQTLYGYSAQLCAYITRENMNDYAASANAAISILTQLREHARAVI